eukprot:553694-Prymnesium_polylepis.1
MILIRPVSEASAMTMGRSSSPGLYGGGGAIETLTTALTAGLISTEIPSRAEAVVASGFAVVRRSAIELLAALSLVAM